MQSFSKPTDDEIARAISLLGSPQHEEYFLRNLQNHFWIAPLKERGFFAYPPEAQQVEGEGIRFPHWPASQYLARMAEHAPADVAAMFAEIKTTNTSIVGDMLDAALKMPADLAANLVPAIRRAVAGGALGLGLSDAFGLCSLLALGGRGDAALALVKCLAVPMLSENSDAPRQRDVYWYKDGLAKVLPDLAVAVPTQLVETARKWLLRALSNKGDAGYSYIWRPAIEDNEQNNDHDVASMFVGVARDAFQSVIAAGQLSLHQALEMLDRDQNQVFTRLAIHLVNVFAEDDQVLARGMMLDRDRFEDFTVKHEYAALIGARWECLTPDERDTWLSWVDAGPDMSGFNESVLSNTGKQATDDDRRRRIVWWQYEKLYWIRGHLTGDRLEFYDAMRREPELSDLNVRIGPVRRGSESPMTVEELKARSFDEVVHWVSSWRPSSRTVLGPEREGLANTFGQYVAGDAAGFSRHAAVMRSCPPIYVRTFLSKMEEAIKANQDIDVTAVLGLCEWVIHQPATETVDKLRDDVELWDRTWQWTRGEIARLIEAACKATVDGESRYSVEEYRDAIWAILEPLAHGCAQTSISSDRSSEDPRTNDYVQPAINSPRGKAMEAALEYARWIGKHFEEPMDGGTFVPDGFDKMPEFRSMLEWQIEPSNATVEAFAVIGMQAGLLYWLDNRWFSGNASTVFSIEPYEGGRSRECGWAAWNAFIVWASPHVEFYKLFKSQYAYAVEQCAALEPTGRAREQPGLRLAEHLIVLYGRGHLPLEQEDALIRRFIERASPVVRQHAFSFLGWSFRREDAIPQSVLIRFTAIWDFYWAHGGGADAQSSDEDLFGRWFSSGKFPIEWSLDRLEQYVNTAQKFEADDELVKRLADVVTDDVPRVLSILKSLVHADQHGWRIHSWLEPAAKILTTALAGSEAAQKNARALIEYLGRRGFLQFGELLKTA